MIKVLSLFDGISCGRVALKELNIECHYAASEVCENAMAISKKNWPDIVQWGDVNRLHLPFVPDLILAGPPCQDLSTASHTRTGLCGERSGLFFRFLNLLKLAQTLNPNLKFLMENVRMKDSESNKITQALGVKPVAINSSDYVPQSRQRLYWFNWEMSPNPPKHRPTLQDILLDGVVDREVSYCIDANYGKTSNPKRYAKGSRQIVFKSNKDLAFFEKHKESTKSTDIEFRILYPEECEVLQGLPVGYTQGVSKFWRYHGLGNGWTVPVIKDIVKDMPLR